MRLADFSASVFSASFILNSFLPIFTFHADFYVIYIASCFKSTGKRKGIFSEILNFMD